MNKPVLYYRYAIATTVRDAKGVPTAEPGVAVLERQLAMMKIS